ncbi:TusE/DsrC/DsvC family sulfur relay protein [Marichromatium bheemlicum]|uniref:Sulfurtransferase n=1 Tax=Marichromatium bheemlicum TaxID=365339 RepID=A0ABX1IB42_9GAMM|nr:TusE/DsrC/DsvC family sulfur relay protein [Marichromatium bheemlicum]NKN34448.1 TusE/DsrC/DsvC family sulfur relay protein [Marichromatium bheemlicum]
MAIEVNGKTIATTANGYLENAADWNEAVAEALAAEESVELSERHWDVIRYLREEYFDNGQNQPMERAVLKAMAQRWGSKPTSKDLYQLFPLAPTKQGTRIAGLPEVRRKGGY